MNLERLYLDYNATSPLSKSVIDWLKSGDLYFANPSSQHSDGKHSRKLINETRSLLYKSFFQSEKETKLFFHSGATEAFHTFAHSFSEIARQKGKSLLICFSKVDHPAVTSLSEKYLGSHVEFFDLARDENLHYEHKLNLMALKARKEQNPGLIILYHHLWVHNETGQIASLQELEAFKELPDLYLHVDAVQAPGKISDWQSLCTGDIWSFSAHKFGALKGVGFTFFKSVTPFHPLLTGGSQQGNLRSGTENVQGVYSLSLALKDLLTVDVRKNIEQRGKLVTFLKESLKGIGSIIDDEKVASNTIYFYLNNLSSDVALALFDLNGIEISAGSACSSGAAKASAVLLQKGFHDVAKNGLRLSMPLTVTDKELLEIQNRLSQVFGKLKS